MISTSSPDAARRRLGRRAALLVAAAAVAVAALVQVHVIGPPVGIHWRAGVDAGTRTALERKYGLRNGRPAGDSEWRYQLDDTSHANIAALVRDPAVTGTSYLDRQNMTAERSTISIGIRQLPFPFDADQDFRSRRQFFQVQSLCALLVGVALLLAAGNADRGRRARLAVVSLLVFLVLASFFTLRPSAVHMGDYQTYLSSFQSQGGVSEIGFDEHLSRALLGRLYRLYGSSADAPRQAFVTLAYAATVWFVFCAIVLGALEEWSPVVVRYLGLAVLAPATLMYFGYRELGYLCLNVAAFPLLTRGLRDGTARVEGGGALAGLGAALHGFGLLSIAGAAVAAVVAPVRIPDRIVRALRLIAWATAFYVGWIAIYILVLKLPVTVGHAGAVPWRPWLVDRTVEDRVNVAILSVLGARDLSLTAWAVGAPLLVVAGSLWRRHRADVLLAFAYAVPSVVFTVAFWPIQGLGVDTDLVIAAFPAVYALAWVCAHERRQTLIAAVVLLSGHLAFWRIVLDGRFMN
ncbi:MAG TPA: hypothetical protein VG871_07980 [Vicinamibacterales bacterium]|nr:hypothetical protein [Vicinamibacterales bacterium]